MPVDDRWLGVDEIAEYLGYFYKFQPPRPLEEIEADIRTVEKEILAMLAEVAG